MIRNLTLAFALSAAVMMPARTSTASKRTVRDSKASHLSSLSHTVARSGYIIASS